MKLKMLKKIPASLDGVAILELVPEQILEINESVGRQTELAELLTREGFAVIVSDEEAAAHLKALAELSPEEKLELAALHEEKAAAEAAFVEAEKNELRESRAGRGRKSAAKSKPPEVILPPPPPASLVVGDVVQKLGAEQPMTVEKLEADLAECVWFAADNSGPFRDVFAVRDLVKVKA